MEGFKKSNNLKSFKEYKKHKCPPIAELITTEENYIERLGIIIHNYMAEYFDEKSDIPVPASLREYNGLVFGNIVAIYEWHKNYFLEALKQSQHSIRDLSKIFVENEVHFHMYAKFANNTKVSEYLISSNRDYFEKVQEKLNEKFHISTLMMEPVQRTVRYPMVLREILKHITKRNSNEEDKNSLTAALKIMEEVCRETNELTDLNAIKNFDGNISDQGKLFRQGYLMCTYDGKKRKLYVFLFKRLILFTEKEESKSKFDKPTYNYRLKIPVNKLLLKELANRKFFLQLNDPNVLNCSVICKANSREEHEEWIQAIKQQLVLQMNLIHDLVHPNGEDHQREVLL